MRKPLLVLTLASVATLWACGADSDTPREYRVVADPAPAEPIDGSGLICTRVYIVQCKRPWLIS